jgi:DNA polymerase III subunit delta
MTHLEIVENVKKGKIAPYYVLHGDEPFFIDQIAEALEKYTIPEEQKSFNQSIFFGKELNLGSLLNLAKSFPMMGGNQLILIKEAQAISGFGGNDRKEDKDLLPALEAYFKNPQSSTILVLCFDSVDERKTWVKAANTNGVVFKSKKFYDNALPDWIRDFATSKGKKISPKAIQLLVESIGHDLKQIAAELDKISLNLKPDEEISADTIERYVGISKEYNVFELQKALGKKDLMKVNKIIVNFANNPKNNPLVQILASLFTYYSKILLFHGTQDKSERNLASVLGVNPYFVKDYIAAARFYPYPKTVAIIHQLALADLQSKGIDRGSKTEKDILLDLTFAILH